ncbi:lipopolysaccharide biosynthesis protein [Glaciimonas sp. GG7]
MLISDIKKWISLISKFLGGQAFVQIINLITALLLLRILPTTEYGLFITANLFLGLGSTGSDLNLSTAMTTYGTKLSDDKIGLSRLYASALHFRRYLLAFISIFVIAISYTVFHRQGLDTWNVCIFIALILITCWVQQKSVLRNVILNIHHDWYGNIQSSLSGAVIRLVLTLSLCYLLPFALVSIITNLITCIVMNWLLKSRCKLYLDENEKYDSVYLKQLWTFILPLIPGALYFAFQVQISIFLISILGDTKSIAEVGALGRFGQIFAFFGMLNGFLFQPIFSRMKTKQEFIKLASFILLLQLIFFGLVFTSAIIFPEKWLLLLGHHYTFLTAEVALAFAAPIITYFVGFLFTLLAARAYTSRQYLYVIATLSVQIIFIQVIGIDTTHKALLLNLANAITTLTVQIALLRLLLKNWR